MASSGYPTHRRRHRRRTREMRLPRQQDPLWSWLVPECADCGGDVLAHFAVVAQVLPGLGVRDLRAPFPLLAPGLGAGLRTRQFFALYIARRGALAVGLEPCDLRVALGQGTRQDG